MAKNIIELDRFIENALLYLNSYFIKKIGIPNIELYDVYPYLRNRYAISSHNHISDPSEDIFDYLGILYESLIPNCVRKDLGQFYTRDDEVIEMMVNSANVLSGKILEPSCGSGLFLVKIIKICQIIKRNFCHFNSFG